MYNPTQQFVHAFRTFSESEDPRAAEWLRCLSARIGEGLLSAASREAALEDHATAEIEGGLVAAEVCAQALRRIDAADNCRAWTSAVNLTARAHPDYHGQIDLSEDPWSI